jgi:hypothetical protein
MAVLRGAAAPICNPWLNRVKGRSSTQFPDRSWMQVLNHQLVFTSLTPVMTDEMMNTRDSKKTDVVLLRGRAFSQVDLKIVKDYVAKYHENGRTFISLVLCDALNWKQPNGWPKDRACRAVLVELEKRNVISLPPIKRGSKQKTKNNYPKRTFVYVQVPHDKIELVFAKGNAAERQWNSLVDSHHYLGHKIVVGRCIKYLVKYNNKTVGAICFSSAAWQVKNRDEVFRQIGFTPAEVRERVLNNSRFLILPNVRIPNLASSVLSLASKQIARDWNQFYGIRPKAIETFVQPSKFKGTCYSAANWVEVGTTSGYAKKGDSHSNSQEPKLIFLYGLTSSVRSKLLKIPQRNKAAIR